MSGEFGSNGSGLGDHTAEDAKQQVKESQGHGEPLIYRKDPVSGIIYKVDLKNKKQTEQEGDAEQAEQEDAEQETSQKHDGEER